MALLDSGTSYLDLDFVVKKKTNKKTKLPTDPNFQNQVTVNKQFF